MKEPIWIDCRLVLFIHKQQIIEHGGDSDIRDMNLLLSALDKPQNLFHYGEPDFADLAASYAFGISRNHPFLDGNKRVSVVVCEVFLELNNLNLNVSDHELYETFMSLAASELSEKGLSDWIRRYI